jgi:hypothetical protein
MKIWQCTSNVHFIFCLHFKNIVNPKSIYLYTCLSYNCLPICIYDSFLFFGYEKSFVWVEIWRKLATKINTRPAQTPGPPPLGLPPSPRAPGEAPGSNRLLSLSLALSRSVFQVLCRYRGVAVFLSRCCES